uniref:Subtilisin-like protease n=1 Tax=Oryza brachyantha TaxID=4533 RepID=J3MMD1_ORYBR
MASSTSKPLQSLALFLLLAQLTNSAFVPKPKNRIEHRPQLSNTYVVHANHLLKPPRFATLEHWYISMVATHSPRAATNGTVASAAGRILYTYDTVMHGFAVRLAADEARRMSRVPGVTAVREGRMYYPQTTRSPGFIGLDPEYGLWSDTDFGDGVIIGFVDSGIWPESPSFNDSGLGPVRRSWKGGCVGLDATLCNNKLVGAKDFSSFSAAEVGGPSSPRDEFGHGTHVASTAAGSEVHDAGLFMFARGTARGVAPKARVAMYKCGGHIGCSDAAIIAAIDSAVKDGVDIISISLGGFPVPFYDDSLAIATLGAEREGVFVALAGGNDGPGPYSVSNVAPWVTTVGAAAVDRLFPANLTLGSGEVLIGQSLYTMKATHTTMTPLVLLTSCDEQSLLPDVVMGKVVVCLRFGGVYVARLLQDAGGAGLVAVDGHEWHGDGVVAEAFTLPALTLSYSKSEKLMDYMESEANPVASFGFACETVTGENRAPTAVGFSSRGPNSVVPELLKPDVLAPGLNILAAWPSDVPVSVFDPDTRRSNYNIMSGTSMACPHAAGVAALIKKRHGDWTPAMIRSGMMTTAATLDNSGRDITDQGVQQRVANATFTSATPLAAGAGHVRPQLAADPGLVYDAGVKDYVDFLCSLNYTVEQLRVFVPDTTGCTTTLPGGPANLNYPSFVVAFNGSTHGHVRKLTRTVTKVYEKPETYRVAVSAPAGVKVTVKPATLEFKEKNEKKSYTVEFRSVKRGHAKSQSWDFGHIAWENRKHQFDPSYTRLTISIYLRNYNMKTKSLIKPMVKHSKVILYGSNNEELLQLASALQHTYTPKYMSINMMMDHKRVYQLCQLRDSHSE